MKLTKLFLGALLAINLMFAVGCSKDDDPVPAPTPTHNPGIVGVWKTQTFNEGGCSWYDELHFNSNNSGTLYEYENCGSGWKTDDIEGIHYEYSGGTIKIYSDYDGDILGYAQYSGGNSFVLNGTTFTRQ